MNSFNCTIIINVILLFSPVRADYCNPHATLIETESFYLTQPFSKNISIDLSNYVEAFPKLGTLIPKFREIFKNYTTNELIDAEEPMKLIPFTDELNIFVVTGENQGNLAFKQCASNGGHLIKVNSQNRAQIANIMKENKIEQTPFHSLPYYSLLSIPDFEALETPENPADLQPTWQKSPPWLTKDNTIIMPGATIMKEGSSVTSNHAHYKSQILCTKTSNPWDLALGRKEWFRLTPKLKTVLSMLNNLKTSYELSSKSFQSVPRVTKQIADLFKLTLPEPFQYVLSFLDKYTKKAKWNEVHKTDQFKNFIKTAIKLVRQFDFNPSSITKLPQTNPRFSPPSINELNWRESFGLDENIYGIVGPVYIKPIQAYVENEQIINPSFFEATISARVYNRLTDKITIYTVKPNSVNHEMAAIRTVVETKKLKVALTEDIKPLQCTTMDTEQFKICHKMPIKPVSHMSVGSLIKCADALFSTKISPDFAECPKTQPRANPSVYRAECGPEGQTTAIINSDSPVMLEFKCDDKSMPKRNVTSFPTFITTPCEVHIVQGAGSQIVLPQFNADFLQDQDVGDVLSIEIPAAEITKTLLIVICIVASIASTMVIVAIAIISIICCNTCHKRKHRQRNRNYPAIQLHEFPFSN